MMLNVFTIQYHGFLNYYLILNRKLKVLSVLYVHSVKCVLYDVIWQFLLNILDRVPTILVDLKS